MDRKRCLSILLSLAAILTLSACNARVTGSGDLITETREVRNFDRITLSGTGDVIVSQNGSESLSIQTDDNVMKYLKVEVDGGTLSLGFKSGFRIISPSQLVFYVGVDDLAGLSISGSGDIESERIETGHLEAKVSGSGDVHIADLTADEVNAEISGAGEIDLTGHAAGQDVTISGIGKYLAGDLCGERVTVSISGAGDATVCAMETLDSTISGGGNVNYYGRPALTTSHSGTGRTNSLGDK